MAMLSHQGRRVVASGTIWPTKLKMFTIWFFGLFVFWFLVFFWGGGRGLEVQHEGS